MRKTGSERAGVLPEVTQLGKVGHLWLIQRRPHSLEQPSETPCEALLFPAEEAVYPWRRPKEPSQEGLLSACPLLFSVLYTQNPLLWVWLKDKGVGDWTGETDPFFSFDAQSPRGDKSRPGPKFAWPA